MKFGLNYIFLFFLYFFLAVFSDCFAQETQLKSDTENTIQFDRVDLSDLITNEYINCIGQDSFGFMWFGTRDGLCRYDGKNLEIYKSIPGDSTSLSTNEIQNIFTDSNGNLWIAAEGLHKYNPEKDNYTRIKPPAFDSLTLKLQFINSVCEDNEGNLWLGTFSKGLYKFNPASGKIIYIRLGERVPPPFGDFVIYSLSFDGKDKIWAASNGHQFVSISTSTNEINHYYLSNKDESGKPKGDIQKLFVDRKGNFWLAQIAEPLKQIFIDKNNKFSYKTFENVKTENFFVYPQDDINGNIWLGTQSEGIFVFNPKKNETNNYRFNTHEVQSLSGNEIEEIFEDNSGNIWLATNKGVCKWSRWKKPFRHFQYDSENSNLPTGQAGSIGSSEVTGIDEDNNGNLWISTLNTGFSKLNLKTKKITRYDPTNSNIKSPWALEILSANDGTVWIATNFKHGLNHFDPESGNIKEYLNNPEDETTISSNLITLLFQDKQNRIWIGAASQGLNLFDPSIDSFKRFSLNNKELFSIYEDDNSVLWLGTSDGLIKFNPDKNSFDTFSPVEFNSDTTKKFEVLSIADNSKNILWIGTDSGLYFFNTEDKSFKRMSELTGLPDSKIFGILKDDSGNLWMQTISALVKFYPENQSYRIYNRHDGWIQSGVNEREWKNSCIKLKSGEMVFGGSNGITIFNPGEIKDNPEIPPIYLTGFSWFNQPVEVNDNPFGMRNSGDPILTKSILMTDKITLSHDENSFTFHFASLDFTNPSANQFKYKLEGFNKDWINSGNINSASFTNIPPGEYVFSVKASNSDGTWNEKGASIKIIILHPWWQTTFAYIVYGLICLVILYWVRRFEINRIKTLDQLKMKEFETKKLQEVDRMKSNFFANISHEFRTPLTLILGILDKYLKKSAQDNSDFKVMKKNAERSLQLINQLLELSKIESGSAKMQVQKTDIIKFIRRISSAFISLADQKKIEFSFNDLPLSSASTENKIFAFIDHEKIETVVYNLLSNAFKFTPEGEKILLDLSASATSAEISITNSGVEIPEEELPFVFDRFYQGKETTKTFEGTGIGLALVKELVEMHHGKVNVTSSGNTTTFKIYLLKGSSHFSEDQLLKEEKEFDLTTPAIIPVVDEIQSTQKNLRTGKSESKIVLVVEDHFDLRNFICEQLEDDFSVIEAEDGEKGLALAEELIPDLVISDIMMPKMDGYQLCKGIKTNFKTNHIPVILLTAKASLENKLEGLETGADDYLIKPFNTDELKTRVRNLIRVRQQMREKFQSEMILKPADVIVPSNQKIFIEKITSIIEKNIEDENFSVEILSKEIGMSRSQLHRKLKALTNQTPSEFIRTFRLKRAADLITLDAGNIAEISYKVGFSSQAYFTKLFQEMFGSTPSEFRKQIRKSEDRLTEQE